MRIIDLLDEEVALTPVHRVSGQSQSRPSAFTEARNRAVAALAGLDIPGLAPLERRRDLPMTSVGELARAGVVTVHQGPLRMSVEEGGLPVLTAKDLLLGRAPSGRTEDEPGLIVTERGDVVAPLVPRGDTVVRVMREGGAALGPQLLLFRTDPERLDPHFLAGCLRVTGETSTRLGSSTRMDPRRARLPRLPIDEQRAYGDAFRRLLAFEDSVHEIRRIGDDLVRSGFDGLLDGTLHPRVDSPCRSSLCDARRRGG
ncbi:hypothetical protein FHS43_004937 [Streptosporangium becharense]|uniref:Type I restriction modification DNA specificity domain-containing protein n=1 Tax=Streptosporangium becharense TaxID=1816182 RepID=A0A7W9MEU4_9ACTN|nr:hypothetical protein [Streptosporangium becharense]MBB2913628.1 hypothetical protein [Streptosporangium becharense]MBB5817709.1 hypothetical protein [Streptosporangium becharense]